MARFEFRRYRLPFRTVVRTAHGPWTEREGVIVRLGRDEGEGRGAGGWGEAAPIPWFGSESVDEIEAACRELGERVDAARIASVPERLGCLRAAIAAAWERDEGRDVANRGDSSTPDPRPLSPPPALGVAALLPAGRAALAPIAEKAEAGFRIFKWKVGVGAIADELALLDDVCAALPNGARLRLDANGAWERRHAERWLERCAERPVEFVEQPIAAEARGAHDVLLGLAGDYPTPLALDESLTGDRDLETWLGAGWPGFYVVKPSLHGDVTGALERLARAKARVVFSSALETAVGARAALRRAFAWPGERFALGFGVWPLFADARFDGPVAAPFIRLEDVERIDAARVWDALAGVRSS